MKKQEILEWLDRMVELHKNLLSSQTEYEDSGISFCENNNIQVYIGIEYLAAAAEVPLIREVWEDKEHTVEYSFEYKGVRINQLEKPQYPLKENPYED